MIYINDHIEQFNLDEALQIVSEQRREKALQFRHEEGRRLCIAAYLLLKEGLQREYGIIENPIFCYAKNGKPSIKGLPEIHFNMSHCRAGAVCAIDNQPVGIDIESIREAKEGLVKYTMNAQEQDLILSSSTPNIEFTRLWTQKEAVLKLTGQGIVKDLKQVLADKSLYRLETITSPDGKYIYTVARYQHTGNHQG